MRATKSLIITSTVLVLSGVTVAQEGPEFSSNVALTTDYVFRGLSQTDRGPAVQGGFDISHSGFYGGVWASSVDFGDDTTMEIDFYGGYTHDMGAATVDVGVIYYAYPDSPELATGSQEFAEIYAGVSGTVAGADVGISIAYSPEFYGETGEATYIQTSLDYPLMENLSASFSYGISDFSDGMLNRDYQDIALGVTANVGPADWTLQYVDTFNIDDADNDAFVLSVARSF